MNMCTYFFCLRVVHLVYAWQRQYNQDSLVILWEVMSCFRMDCNVVVRESRLDGRICDIYDYENSLLVQRNRIHHATSTKSARSYMKFRHAMTAE
jgi:hypothetical protein